MTRTFLKTLLAASCASVAFVGSAGAGGFSRGNADTDILYEPGNFNMRAGATWVSPNRDITGSPNSAGLIGTSYTPDYVMPSAAIKIGLGEYLSCAGTIATPYGGHAEYDVPDHLDRPTMINGAIANFGKKYEEFTITEMGLTCGVKFQVGPGNLYVLGGGFQERFDYDRANWLSPDGSAVARLQLDGTQYGYRVGAAYEVPEIALRGELMYRSGTEYGAEGTLTLGPLSAPAIGKGELPQSVEFSLQSGIAPGWLAFTSVKWTDWSVTKQLIVESQTIIGPVVDTNNYFWKDGWTITAGVGHAFNETVSGLVALTYDQGVTTGYDLSSDTWGIAAGVSIKDKFGGELRFGGGATYIEQADEYLDIVDGEVVREQGLAVDDGWALAASVSYALKW